MQVAYLLLVITCAFGARVYVQEENDIRYQKYSDLFKEEEVTVTASEQDVSYYIYSNKNIDTPHIIKNNKATELSDASHFDPKKKTVFVIHGWVDDYTADVNRLLKTAILKVQDSNIIVVDWGPIASQSYGTAQGAVTVIGQIVGGFINNMIHAYGLNSNQITIIGHSLGAHIAGNAGAETKSKVAHIIGLDPAGPYFTVDDINNRLDPSDADYVQIIHTNTRLLGFASSIGHADYYPNGGQVQAGCGLDLLAGCSHERSFLYLEEAIAEAKFTATQCGSYKDFQNNKCAGNKKTYLGKLDVDKSVVGEFFLDTNTKPPFSKG